MVPLNSYKEVHIQEHNLKSESGIAGEVADLELQYQGQKKRKVVRILWELGLGRRQGESMAHRW
jgi:translation initiation factor 1 (eIF-1/SUI1)